MTQTAAPSHRDELFVLSLIGAGLIVIIVLIICGIFGWFQSKTQQPLPSWAENVLVALGTASILKLGDVLAALVTLATGRQVEAMGARLADSAPAKKPVPADAAHAAEQVADAATSEAADIKGAAPDKTEGTSQ